MSSPGAVDTGLAARLSEKARNDSFSRSEDVTLNPSLDDEENRKTKEEASVHDEGSAAADQDPYLVRLETREDPKQMSSARKWLILVVIAGGSLCATCASSMVCFLSILSSEVLKYALRLHPRRRVFQQRSMLAKRSRYWASVCLCSALVSL